eukprot:12357675-Heterocapsa_arctica.AAC.1
MAWSWRPAHVGQQDQPGLGVKVGTWKRVRRSLLLGSLIGGPPNTPAMSWKLAGMRLGAKGEATQ